MPNRAKTITARKGPMPASTVSTIDSRLKKASDFILSEKEVILRSPTAKMPMPIAVAAFCVIKRMEAAIHRRLGPVRERLDEILELKLESMKPGEHEQKLTYGPFGVIVRNDNHDRTEINTAKLMALLGKKKIAPSAVFIQPPPPPAFASEERLRALVAAGKITTKEYDSVVEFAQPRTSVHVDVPKLVDKVIESRLLGGINQVSQ